MRGSVGEQASSIRPLGDGDHAADSVVHVAPDELESGLVLQVAGYLVSLGPDRLSFSLVLTRDPFVRGHPPCAGYAGHWLAFPTAQSMASLGSLRGQWSM